MDLPEEKVPIHRMNLGALVREMQKIVYEDPIVLILTEDRIAEVPEHSLERFKRYNELSRQLDMREKKYW